MSFKPLFFSFNSTHLFCVLLCVLVSLHRGRNTFNLLYIKNSAYVREFILAVCFACKRGNVKSGQIKR